MQKQRFLRFAGHVNEIEFFEGILNRIDHRCAPDKLQNHVADPCPADAADFVQSADNTERLLNPAADVILDFLRCRAGVLCADSEGGVAHLRHQRDWQLAKREVAKDHRGQKYHQHCDWSVGGEVGIAMRGLHADAEGAKLRPALAGD